MYMYPAEMAYMMGTPERIFILHALMEQGRGKVRPLSRSVGVSAGLVSRYLNFLYDIGLVDRKGNDFVVLEKPENEAVRGLLEEALDIVYEK